MPTVAELGVDVDADDNATKTLEQIDAFLKQLAGTEAEVVLSANDTDLRRDVEWAQDALFDLESRDVEVPVSVPTDEVRAEYEQISQMLADLEDRVEIPLDLDKAAFTAELNEAKAQLATLTEQNENIDLDIGGALLRIAELEAALKAIPDEKVTVEVDTDVDRLKNITSAASRASTQVSALVMAILLLGPALIPIGAVALGALGALNAALTAATVGAVLFGAVAITNFKDITDALEKMSSLQDQYNLAVTDKQKETALEKMKVLMASLTEPQRQMVIGIQALQKSWKDFAGQFQSDIFALAAEGMSLLATLLPKAAPLMHNMAMAAKDLMLSFEDALDSPFLAKFGQQITALAGPIFGDFVRAIGNIIIGILGITNAFFPFAKGVSGGFLDMTQRFAEWGKGLADNPGFKSFMAYVQENTPKVMALFGALITAAVGFVTAIAPWGGVVLGAVTGVLNAIAALSNFSPLLVAIIIAVVGLGAAFLNLAGPILAFITVFQRMGLMLGIAGGWIALIVAAIIALVVGVIYAYTHFETFRNVVNGAWAAIVAAFNAAIPYIQAAFQQIVQWGQQAWQWLVATFGPAVSAVVTWVVAEFNKIVQWAQQNAGLFAAAWASIVPMFQAVWDVIKNIVMIVVNFVVIFVTSAWGGLVNIVQGIWTAISGVISGALQIIRGLITIFAGILAGDWSAVWNGLVDVVSGVWTALVAVLSGAVQVVIGIFQILWAAVKAIWSTIWNTLVDEVKPIIDAVVAVFQWLYDTLVGNSIIPDLVNAVIQWFTQMGAFLSAFMAPIVAVFTAAWNLIRTLVEAAINAVLAIITTVLSAIQAAWSAAWNAIGALLSAIWNTIKSTIQSGISTAKSIVDGFVSAVRSLWQTFWNDFVQRVVQGIADVVAKFRTLGSDVLGYLRGLVGDFLNAGQSLMRSFADGISAGAGWVKDKVMSAVNEAKALLPGSPADEGPFSGKGYTLLRGERMMANFADGIRNSIPAVASAMSDAMGVASGYLSPNAALPGGSGGGTVQVAAGAVQIALPPGGDVEQARRAFSGAGAELATQINVALKRR
jgi:phage-related protein